MSLHPGTTPAPLLDLIHTDAAFDTLASEWEDLLSSSSAGGIFLTWPWLSAWRSTIGAGAELQMVTARNPLDGRLVAAAPFAIHRRRRGLVGHRVLTFMGSGLAAPDHLDIVVRRGHEAMAQTLWAETRRRGGWDLADFEGLKAGSLLARVALRRNSDDRHIVDIEPCPYVTLPESWEAYESTLGKNHRQNLRRYGRKMDREAGAPVVERMVTRADEIAPTMQRLGDLHQDVRTARGDRGACGTATR